jgi:hypothetical protein
MAPTKEEAICGHATLERLGPDRALRPGDLPASLYRCSGCGGVVIVTSQFLPGIRALLQEAAERSPA